MTGPLRLRAFGATLRANGCSGSDQPSDPIKLRRFNQFGKIQR